MGRGTWTRRSFLCAALLAASLLPAQAAPRGEKLRAVVTVPDLGDLVRVIGGDQVEIHTICRGKENLHYVSPRPSDLIALSRADLFCQLGLSAEATWLPSLINRARNPKISSGASGFVNVSEGWEAIQVPAVLSRSLGDVHPQGNPHFNLHPLAGRHMARQVCAGLVRVDGAHQAEYEQRLQAYEKLLDRAEARWAAVGARFRGKRVVEYHQEFNYLEQYYGIVLDGALEPKPGTPPTPKHLAELVGLMRAEGTNVILTAAWSNNSFVEDVAKKADAKAVELPNMVEEKGTWVAMMDEIHLRLARAFGVEADELKQPPEEESGESHAREQTR